MSQKRQQQEEEDSKESDDSGEKRQKGAAFRELVREAMRRNTIQNFLSTLEPLLRRVVKEEVEVALAKHLHSMKRQCGKQIYPSSSRSLRLRFMSMLSLPIFTGTKIEGEDNAPLSIAMVDDLTGDIVKCGPESSLKVEVVVLEGDFDGNEQNDWTFAEFRSNIVKEREGKRALLVGDTVHTLDQGTCVVSELAFTDNSSWTRCRKFRLGARVDSGHFNGTSIKEAMTEQFVVKDHRGELYKKHHPPKLDDEVWRLEKIGKDGAFHKRLSREKIRTVKDFLRLLSMDTPKLRNILGNGMSTKMWEVTEEHARTCVLNKQLYVYYQDDQNKIGVVFNVIGELKGIFLEQQYISVAELSDMQKTDALNLVKLAFEHGDKVHILEKALPRECPDVPTHLDSSESPSFGVDFSNETSSSQKAHMPDFLQPNFSAADIFSPFFTDCSRSDSSLMPSRDMESAFSSFQCHDGYNPDSLFFDAEPSGKFAEDHSVFFASDSYFPPDSLGIRSPGDLSAAVSGFLPARGKINRKWTTLLLVFRLASSLKRIVASKRLGAPG